MIGQRFTERPKGFLVWRLVGVGESKKAFEAQTVGNLKLKLLVAELVEVLDHEGLEHHRGSKGRSSAQALGLGLGNALENCFKECPVDHLIETGQRITHFVQFFQSHGLVKKAALIGFNILRHGAPCLDNSALSLQQ